MLRRSLVEVGVRGVSTVDTDLRRLGAGKGCTGTEHACPDAVRCCGMLVSMLYNAVVPLSCAVQGHPPRESDPVTPSEHSRGGESHFFGVRRMPKRTDVVLLLPSVLPTLPDNVSPPPSPVFFVADFLKKNLFFCC